MKDVNTNMFYVTVNTDELIEVVSMECMPLSAYDEEKFECIKSELTDMLDVDHTAEDEWLDKDTYVYARNEKYTVGVADNTSNYPRIFIDTVETNSDVVINSLRSLVSKFGSSLVELPDTLR